MKPQPTPSRDRHMLWAQEEPLANAWSLTPPSQLTPLTRALSGDCYLQDAVYPWRGHCVWLCPVEVHVNSHGILMCVVGSLIT